MKLNIEELRRFAKAATKGQWIAVGAWVENVRDDLKDICNCSPNGNEEYSKVVSDAEYIAAFQPSTALSLLNEIEQLIAQRDEAVSKLKSLSDEILGLIGESHGVVGLHLNGDVAPWSELEPGGRFERLTSLHVDAGPSDNDAQLVAQSPDGSMKRGDTMPVMADAVACLDAGDSEGGHCD